MKGGKAPALGPYASSDKAKAFFLRLPLATHHDF